MKKKVVINASPDLKQALLISKLFNISLDELVNNDKNFSI